MAHAEPPARGHIALQAEAAVLTIAPAGTEKRFLDLPPLEYSFRIEAGCAEDARPASFALTVADSRVALSRSQLAAKAPSSFHELRLTIPAEQLAPIALTRFCVAPAADDDGATAHRSNELLIPAAMAAHASLLCTNDEAQSMTYISTPLDLKLICAALPEPPENGR